MEAIDNFSLRLLPGRIYKPDLTDKLFAFFEGRAVEEWQESPTRSELLLDNRATFAEIDGIELKAQFKHRDGYLIFSAYDYYDGEENYISFVNFDFAVLDTLTIGGAFAHPGDYIFDFRIISADEIEFSAGESFVPENVRKRRLKIISPPIHEIPFDCAELTARNLRGHFSKHYLKLETEIV